MYYVNVIRIDTCRPKTFCSFINIQFWCFRLIKKFHYFAKLQSVYIRPKIAFSDGEIVCRLVPTWNMIFVINIYFGSTCTYSAIRLREKLNYVEVAETQYKLWIFKTKLISNTIILGIWVFFFPMDRDVK